MAKPKISIPNVNNNGIKPYVVLCNRRLYYLNLILALVFLNSCPNFFICFSSLMVFHFTHALDVTCENSLIFIELNGLYSGREKGTKKRESH